MSYPQTPDGRYFIVKERLWRTANPNLAEVDRQRFVKDLMDARRAVKAAKASGDSDAMRAARAAVDKAKHSLGERGPTWWNDDTDFNRYLVRNTPYHQWWQQLMDSSGPQQTKIE